ISPRSAPAVSPGSARPKGRPSARRFSGQRRQEEWTISPASRPSVLSEVDPCPAPAEGRPDIGRGALAPGVSPGSVPESSPESAQPREGRAVPRTVAFLNQKGGVGKTSTVHHLGGTLARRGLQVLVVDADPQASLTQGLLGPDAAEDLDPRETIA